MNPGLSLKPEEKRVSGHSQYGMSPAEYRQKWGLPDDYPMVAPNYARQRSELAKTMGLGKGGVQRQRPKK